ncbi:hypothetical protein [Neobacillus mesonae]|uniref:hypothetical protein n=1 Tax=Neobacillus mesonae TaxID=1193713 RepID=UPI00203E0D45|nr:hypothetical protein [Neobacillus mesonae]MCM3569747.1 hypothetical protein [Neobacillus mesonae]
MRLMEGSWIAREGRKIACAVNGRELDCPGRGKNSMYGQWSEAGLPVKEEI